MEDATGTYLADRRRSFAALLPTDTNDHVEAVMQYVEKLIARKFPSSVGPMIHILALGYVANYWRKFALHVVAQHSTWGLVPWPSVIHLLGPHSRQHDGTPHISIKSDSSPALICTLPRNAIDKSLPAELHERLEPRLCICENYPWAHALRKIPVALGWKNQLAMGGIF